jgi:hypothetical protein
MPANCFLARVDGIQRLPIPNFLLKPLPNKQLLFGSARGPHLPTGNLANRGRERMDARSCAIIRRVVRLLKVRERDPPRVRRVRQVGGLGLLAQVYTFQLIASDRTRVRQVRHATRERAKPDKSRHANDKRTALRSSAIGRRGLDMSPTLGQYVSGAPIGHRRRSANQSGSGVEGGRMKSLALSDLDEWLRHGPAGAHFVYETAPETGEYPAAWRDARERAHALFGCWRGWCCCWA